MSHSSIVAREYGIPAVLGTGVATQRLTSGQRIHVEAAGRFGSRESAPIARPPKPETARL